MIVNRPKKSPKAPKAPIKNWAINDRPREKLLSQGAQVLSDAELLAILLGSGSTDKSAVELGRELMQLASNNLHELGQKDIKVFRKIKGIGDARAVAIAAALELGRRRSASELPVQPALTCSQDAIKILRPLIGDQHTEHLYVLFLNRGNKLIHYTCISHGGTASTVVDPKVIFEQALLQKASRIMLGHNHPSGNMRPSHSDIAITNKIKAAGEMLEIELLDHIILTDESYFSFCENGLL
ncbi:DNA repair protein RadC [Chitinophaga horti]|uniref:DNA repair protein RadC n=1 Tax=Chitinophaga horti TaxID=2920382 RepID=A0ABY6J5M8_9BACT|nr:DNA repair protein RadC [Chitinophaga horti]UYQ93611.1 DNA repair protein RadC [Chitinophaga horti]